MNFIAIDFETANGKKTSACSIGIVVVENLKIVDSQHHLIQPLPNYYNAMNIDIHGITPEMTDNAPTFDKKWNEIGKLLTKYPLLAHNASFDLTVLRDTLIAYQQPLPDIEFYCSLILSRRALPKQSSYGLSALSEYFEIKLNHHNAESDAKASAIIALRMLELHDQNSLKELSNKMGTKTGLLQNDGHFQNFGNGRPIKKKKNYQFTYPSKLNPNHRFYNKHIVFTGKLSETNRKDAMQKVISVGGKVYPDAITPNTNFLVIGKQDFSKFGEGYKSSKVKLAEKFMDQGYPLSIMGENEFLLSIES